MRRWRMVDGRRRRRRREGEGEGEGEGKEAMGRRE
jgi:hypothetical protein